MCKNTIIYFRKKCYYYAQLVIYTQSTKLSIIFIFDVLPPNAKIKYNGYYISAMHR